MTVRTIARTSHALAVAARSGGVDRGVANPTYRAAMRAIAGAVPLGAASVTHVLATVLATVALPNRRSTPAWPAADRRARNTIPVEPVRRNAVALRHGFAAIRPAELFQVVKTG